ncbi:hypothetical protein RIVM261_076400 [Rivularia sp. IAM M-261]|nr:hypothetical protein RIVM261_076400 [Rivularia sp. IAM M-261]
MKVEKQENFRWRYQPKNKLDKELLLYIKEHPALTVTEMMLTALRSFWLPMAVIDSSNYEEPEKERIVKKCVETLLRQAESLQTKTSMESIGKISKENSNSKFNDSGLAGW